MMNRMKLFSRRSAIAFALLSATTLSLSGVTEPAPSAEALSTLRAKITWNSDLPRALTERLPNDTTAYALWRDNLLSRQSNADASRDQVVTGRQFVDEVTFLPSLSIPEAVITVNQPSYSGSYHVRISVNNLPPATQIVLRRAAASRFTGRRTKTPSVFTPTGTRSPDCSTIIHVLSTRSRASWYFN